MPRSPESHLPPSKTGITTKSSLTLRTPLSSDRERLRSSLDALPGLEDQVPLLPTHLSQVHDPPGNPEIQGWSGSFLSPGPKHLLKRRNPLLQEHLVNDESGRGPGTGKHGDTRGTLVGRGFSCAPVLAAPPAPLQSPLWPTRDPERKFKDEFTETEVG